MLLKFIGGANLLAAGHSFGQGDFSFWSIAGLVIGIACLLISKDSK